MGKREKKQISSIDLLPDGVRAMLHELLSDRRMTQLTACDRINAILAKLSAAGELPEGAPENVSKSALNRYAVRMEEVGSKIRQSREMAEMWIGKFGAAPQGQVGLLITETLRTLAYELTMKIQDADIDDPKTLAATIDQLKALALAVQRLEQSTSINVKREGEIRKVAKEEALKTASETARKAGVSEETIEAIWRDVLRMT